MKRIIPIFILLPLFSFCQWTQLGSDIDGFAVNEQSGTSTKLNADGTVLIVGAPRGIDNGITKGKARVFFWNGSSWIQRGEDLIGTNQGDVFGESVSISNNGNIIAVGAPGYNSPSYLTPTGPTGYTRIYEWNGTAWSQLGNDITGEAPNNSSGVSISLNATGTSIAIGATSNNGVNGSFSGNCRIYEWNGSVWTQKGADIDGEAASDFSGAVSLNEAGTIVAIGAAGNDGGGTNAGHVRVYEWNTTNWVQKGTDINGDTTNANFGSRISFDASGTTFIAGGYSFVNGALGFIKVFTWNGTNWVQKGQTILGDNGSDFLGTAVAINQDGSIIATSAVTGSANGYVRIFSYNGSSWVQQGSDILGEVVNDQFGRSLSMSKNGSILAGGTPYNDENGINAGHIRVFQNLNLSTVGFENSTISCYPNPTKDFVYITSTTIINYIKVYSLLGQEVFSKEINATAFDLDLSIFASGTYILNMNNLVEKETIKLVKL